jgi:hypothetical protein
MIMVVVIIIIIIITITILLLLLLLLLTIPRTLASVVGPPACPLGGALALGSTGAAPPCAVVIGGGIAALPPEQRASTDTKARTCGCPIAGVCETESLRDCISG